MVDAVRCAIEVQNGMIERNAGLPAESAAPHHSMVVLPFANIGGDPEQEHFVDEVTESLICT